MSDKFIIPVKGKYRVSSPFGWRKDPVTKKNTRHHNGTDLVTPNQNEPVLAAMNGRVLKAEKSTATNGGFGYYVVIRHMIGAKFYTSLYAHMKAGSLKVKPGQLVKAGDQLGILGDTGYTTGPHLHFEIWQGRTHGWSSDGRGFVDPMKFIPTMASSDEIKKTVNEPTPPTKNPNPAPNHTYAEPKSSAKKPVANKQEKFHVVKAGDTLTKIAKQYKTTVATLKKLNRIADVSKIKAGDLIKLP